MKTFSLLCLLALAAAKKDYTGHKVLQVTPASLPHLKALKSLQEYHDGSHEVMFWNDVVDVHKPVSIQLAPQTQSAILKLMQLYEIDTDIVIDDLQMLIDIEMESMEDRTINGSFALDAYHDYDEITYYLTDLSARIERAEYKSIGKTIEERDIYMFSIASGNKPAISIECNIHAREWITGATCLNLITNLLTNEADKGLRDAYDWYFIPIANPDGYSYTWSDDRMWRKNRREQGVCDGVDLNRNFDANFGGQGSSSSFCSDTYHGKAAFSEPETQALRDFLMGLKDRLVAHWSFHSYGLYYLLPYCYSFKKPSNFDRILSIAETSGEAIQNTHGTKYTIGECASTIYVASGGGHDWVFDALHPSFSGTLELRDQGRYGFILPRDQIIPVFEEVWNGLKAAISVL